MNEKDVRQNEVSVFGGCVKTDTQSLEFYNKVKCAEIRKFLTPRDSWRLWIRFDDVATFVDCSEKKLFNRFLERLGQAGEVHIRFTKEDKL